MRYPIVRGTLSCVDDNVYLSVVMRCFVCCEHVVECDVTIYYIREINKVG